MNQQYIVYLIGALNAITLVGFIFTFIFHKNTPQKQSHGKASKLESSLRDEQIKSDFILNAIEDGVILIDDQKIIRLFNPGAATITGWPVKDATGLDYRSVLKLVDEKGDPYGENDDPFIMVFKSQESMRDNSAILVTKSNKRVSISLSVSPLVDAHKKLISLVGVFQDISEEKQVQAQRAEFISTASHEMRTPVAAIEGYLSLALNDKVSSVDSRARGYLEKAHSSTQSLGKLFQDLLTSAKAEDGRLSSHPVAMDMGQFLESVTEDLRFVAQKKGLLLDFVLGSSSGTEVSAVSNNNLVRPLYYVKADPERLREVVTNLFDNAVKYTPQGKIIVGLTGDNNVVQFYIKDTGAGIPSEDIPHLFQKFYRVDNSTTRTIGGTGLGLFICRKIVELYQGQIWVESELNKGSTFFVNLPRVKSEEAAKLLATEGSDGIGGTILPQR